MKILNSNGNTVKEGKAAANWACKHAKEITGKDVDSAGRHMAHFENGLTAFYFPADEHPKTVAKLARTIQDAYEADSDWP